MKIGILVLVALLALGGVFTRNQLVTQRNAVEASWAQVENVMQRRADLIPNLVETVKGFTKQEQKVFGDIAQARAGLLNARTPQDKMQANGVLDGAIGRLLMVTENYPELKSSENFKHLQDELAGAENRISLERQRYNKTVETYTNSIQQFPANIIAGLFGFTRTHDYFKADPAAKQVPKVSF